MRFFFYGTLCDGDVLRLVLGYRPSSRQCRSATLSGYRRRQAAGRSYPILLPTPAGQVRGLLFTARSSRDLRRLVAYEGPEYITRGCRVRADHAAGLHHALVFLPRVGHLTAGRAAWNPARWASRHKAAFIAAMFGQESLCACPNRLTPPSRARSI